VPDLRRGDRHHEGGQRHGRLLRRGHAAAGGGLMLQLGKRYACETCATEALVTKPSDGELVCCGRPMTLQEPKRTASAD
jgi:hypothetical protein